jgi:hypothetical protein
LRTLTRLSYIRMTGVHSSVLARLCCQCACSLECSSGPRCCTTYNSCEVAGSSRRLTQLSVYIRGRVASAALVQARKQQPKRAHVGLARSIRAPMGIQNRIYTLPYKAARTLGLATPGRPPAVLADRHARGRGTSTASASVRQHQSYTCCAVPHLAGARDKLCPRRLGEHGIVQASSCHASS